jgi:hypothetical protein
VWISDLQGAVCGFTGASLWIYEGEVCEFMRRQCVNLRGAVL